MATRLERRGTHCLRGVRTQRRRELSDEETAPLVERDLGDGGRVLGEARLEEFHLELELNVGEARLRKARGKGREVWGTRR